MQPIEYRGKNKMVLCGKAVLTIQQSEGFILRLVPDDWDAFWQVWHGHKVLLKDYGIDVRKCRRREATKWTITYRDPYYENDDFSLTDN